MLRYLPEVALLLLGSGFFSQVFATPGFELKRIQGKIEGLEWQSEAIEIIDGNVVVPGKFERTYWNLILAENPVTLDSKNRFKTSLPLTGTDLHFEITAIGPAGQTETEEVEVLIPLSALKRKEKKLRFQLGLGATSIYNHQDQATDLTELTATLKGGVVFAINPKWQLGGSGYYTLAPLKTNQTGISAQYLGLNFRVGYFPPWKGPWHLGLLAGWYYTTTFVTNGLFGYQDLSGPQIFPTIQRQLNNGDAVAAYFKFSPVANDLTLLNLNNHEIAGGASYIHPLKNGKSVSVTLDLSSIDLFVQGLNLYTNSVSFGLGYGF